MPGPYSHLAGSPYSGFMGTYPAGPTPNPKLTSAIDDLLTPGLVPDIARMSAEVAAGRGIAGSPAADSTAVRMSEQNWQQRLALANSLMSGQTGRDLPYQITPYQQAWLDLQRTIRGLNQGGMRTGGGGGGGGGTGPIGTPMSVWSNTYPIIEAVRGTGADRGGATPSIFPGMRGGVEAGNLLPLYPGGPTPGGGTDNWTMDDAYEWLGFGNFGSLPGDQTIQPPDFSQDMFD